MDLRKEGDAADATARDRADPKQAQRAEAAAYLDLWEANLSWLARQGRPEDGRTT